MAHQLETVFVVGIDPLINNERTKCLIDALGKPFSFSVIFGVDFVETLNRPDISAYRGRTRAVITVGSELNSDLANPFANALSQKDPVNILKIDSEIQLEELLTKFVETFKSLRDRQG